MSRAVSLNPDYLCLPTLGSCDAVRGRERVNRTGDAESEERRGGRGYYDPVHSHNVLVIDVLFVD